MARRTVAYKQAALNAIAYLQKVRVPGFGFDSAQARGIWAVADLRFFMWFVLRGLCWVIRGSCLMVLCGSCSAVVRVPLLVRIPCSVPPTPCSASSRRRVAVGQLGFSRLFRAVRPSSVVPER